MVTVGILLPGCHDLRTPSPLISLTSKLRDAPGTAIIKSCDYRSVRNSKMCRKIRALPWASMQEPVGLPAPVVIVKDC
jgi:hypothetical protein